MTMLLKECSYIRGEPGRTRSPIERSRAEHAGRSSVGHSCVPECLLVRAASIRRCLRDWPGLWDVMRAEARRLPAHRLNEALEQSRDASAVAASATRDAVLSGFSAIRQSAEKFMDKRDLADDGWTEPEVTSVSVTEGRPHVQVVMFNQNQEGRGPNALGADYLWWWLDGRSGECFGMLVQAKRLTFVGGEWRVDISHRGGEQLRTLLRTARQLQVPAVYSIYTGGLVYGPPFHAYTGMPTRDWFREHLQHPEQRPAPASKTGKNAGAADAWRSL